MSSEAAAGLHEHEEVSAAPLFVVLGIFFLIPLGFSMYFVYESVLLTAVFAGLGVPMLLFGISKWVSEGLEQTHLHFGYAKAGLPIFIISEVFLFLGFFVSYWKVHLTAEVWPPEGTPHIGYLLPIIMTVILVTSSFTIHFAEDKLKEKDEGGFRSMLILTILLGVVFIGCSAYEYNHLLSEGFGTSANMFSTIFYTITGFHVAHVLVGVCIFLAVLFPAFGGNINETFVGCAAVYWHFVDIIWFFVVSQVYFWQ